MAFPQHDSLKKKKISLLPLFPQNKLGHYASLFEKRTMIRSMGDKGMNPKLSALRVCWRQRSLGSPVTKLFVLAIQGTIVTGRASDHGRTHAKPS